jgi:hypothetical protein
VRHFGTWHAKTRRFCAFSGDERAQQGAFRFHDTQFFLIDFDPLGERGCQLRAGGKSPRALSPDFAA